MQSLISFSLFSLFSLLSLLSTLSLSLSLSLLVLLYVCVFCVASWSLHIDDSGLLILLRSLEWPGFEYRLQAGSTHAFDGAYFGTGEHNDDLLFML